MSKVTNELQKNQKEKEVLKPKNDVVFQALFTRGKESITKAMIEDILKIEIHNLELDKSKELLNDSKEDKNGRVDLRAVINNNVEVDIEMQLETHEKMIERFLYYWSKMYTANLQVGNEYRKLRKTISIIIIDGELSNLKEIKESHTKWQIREEKNQEIILTQYLEMHILELPKAIREYKNNKKDEVLQWMMFLENPEDMEVSNIMKENEDIKEAKEELDKISKDDLLRRMALKAELTRMDHEQMMYEAKRDGIKEGEKKEKIEIIKNLYKIQMPIEKIAQIVNMEKEEIEKVINEVK